MKKTLITGIAALALTIGCSQQENTSQTTFTEEAIEEADISINIAEFGKELEPTLIINDSMSYLFTRKNDAYTLTRIFPGQSTDLIIKYSNQNNKDSIIMDLQDGNIYTLKFDEKSKNYKLTY